MQYMYWEKVKPQDEPSLRNRPSVYPLMCNWTQVGVDLREMYDEDNARGRGDVKVVNPSFNIQMYYVCISLCVQYWLVVFIYLQIDDNITEQYRQGPLSTPVANQKSGFVGKNASTSKSAPRPQSNKKATITWEISMEIMMKKMAQELTKKIIDEVPKQCAKVTSCLCLQL